MENDSPKILEEIISGFLPVFPEPFFAIPSLTNPHCHVVGHGVSRDVKTDRLIPCSRYWIASPSSETAPKNHRLVGPV
jgi:hypothetical protein